MITKTIDDVTRQELSDLVEASIDLLSCARMMRWLLDNDDGSYAESIDRMSKAIESCGLPQCTTEEFEERLESMLSSDMPPAKWRVLYDAKAGRA